MLPVVAKNGKPIDDREFVKEKKPTKIIPIIVPVYPREKPRRQTKVIKVPPPKRVIEPPPEPVNTPMAKPGLSQKDV
jgi:hypothetical protein